VQNGKQIGVAWHPDSSHVLVRATSERLDWTCLVFKNRMSHSDEGKEWSVTRQDAVERTDW